MTGQAHQRIAFIERTGPSCCLFWTLVKYHAGEFSVGGGGGGGDFGGGCLYGERKREGGGREGGREGE